MSFSIDAIVPIGNDPLNSPVNNTLKHQCYRVLVVCTYQNIYSEDFIQEMLAAFVDKL